jgi:hypothetical protein
MHNRKESFEWRQTRARAAFTLEKMEHLLRVAIEIEYEFSVTIWRKDLHSEDEIGLSAAAAR